MAPSLLSEPIALPVLKLQAQHIRNQVDSLREALCKHGAESGHLRAALDHLHSIEFLALHVRSAIECEQDARTKLAAHLTEKDRTQAQEASSRG